MSSQEKYHASCKLMLFGEYLVLQGSKSMAFPLKFGQTLTISPSQTIHWKSFSPEGCWFEVEMNAELEILKTNDIKVAEVLKGLFQYIADRKPNLSLVNKYEARADFNLKWGLGSSSTLISLLSQWSGCEPYNMLTTYFGGSGYDIACATANSPILYEVQDRKVEAITLSEAITEKLLFVYLGQKQNSKNEIERFEKSEVTSRDIEQMDEIISKATEATTIEDFEIQLQKSEDLLSPIIGRQKLKEHIFADYKHTIKSMGAWGGDFFLATFRDKEEATTYFRTKGLQTMFTYKELVK